MNRPEDLIEKAYEGLTDEQKKFIDGMEMARSEFDTGEGFKLGEACRRYSIDELIGNIYPWLRDVVSASYAAIVSGNGNASYDGVTIASCVLGFNAKEKTEIQFCPFCGQKLEAPEQAIKGKTSDERFNQQTEGRK